MTKVTAISQDGNGIYHLSLQTINAAGEVTEALSVNCEYLFLGAGTGRERCDFVEHLGIRIIPVINAPYRNR